jgi:nucleoid-associated protein YgaU
VSVVKKLIYVILAVITVVSLSAAREKNTVNYTTYTVSQGDTLWGIASKLYPGSHTGKAVYEIRKLNNIDDPGSIQPGQVIKVWR